MKWHDLKPGSLYISEDAVCLLISVTKRAQWSDHVWSIMYPSKHMLVTTTPSEQDIVGWNLLPDDFVCIPHE